MSDQGKWYKLWVSSLTDGDLDNLPIEEFGRWAKLGAVVKSQGANGSVQIIPPARTLCALFQVPNFEVLKQKLSLLPNVIITPSGSNGCFTVTYKNWYKYQVDSSSERVARFRKSVTTQEEKRREETKTRRDETKKRRDEIKSEGRLIAQCPNFIRQEVWDDFVSHRREMKKPLTARAQSLLWQKLESIGDDPNEVLLQSIRNGWLGIFQLQDKGGGQAFDKASALRQKTKDALVRGLG